jgi:hypothetical protein
MSHSGPQHHSPGLPLQRRAKWIMCQAEVQASPPSAAARGWKAEPLPTSVPRKGRFVKTALRVDRGGHGACCSPATGPADDAANKSSDKEVMLGALGQWIPSDADNPPSSQGDGVGANPRAAPQADGRGRQTEDKVYSAVQDPAVRHQRADGGGDCLRHGKHHGAIRSRRLHVDESSLPRGPDRGARGCQQKS